MQIRSGPINVLIVIHFPSIGLGFSCKRLVFSAMIGFFSVIVVCRSCTAKIRRASLKLLI